MTTDCRFPPKPDKLSQSPCPVDQLDPKARKLLTFVAPPGEAEKARRCCRDMARIRLRDDR